MKKYLYCLFFASLLAACTSSSTLDLAFVNKMQSYEPKFMDMSDKVSYIDRNLSVTDSRYAKDLTELSKYSASDAAFSSSYRAMMTQRDAIKKTFSVEKQNSAKAITAYNDFRNQVLQNQISGESAKKEFDRILKDYQTSSTKIDNLKEQIVHNIEDHNRLTRNLALSVNVYTNFNIDPH